MARITQDEGSPGGKLKGKGGVANAPDAKKAKKARAPKRTKPAKGRSAKAKTASRKGAAAKAKSSGTFREAVGVGAGRQTGGMPAGEHLAGSAQVALELADLSGGAVSGAGLGDILLDLVGEGRIRLSSALQVWQREQDRVANRAWRRPGGMARMGGV